MTTIKTILGKRLQWREVSGWVFEPVLVGPDTIEYTVKEGPHAGRHAVHPAHYHRIAPGIELTSWHEEVGTVVAAVLGVAARAIQGNASSGRAAELGSAARPLAEEAWRRVEALGE